jgi:hypothetical protein
MKKSLAALFFVLALTGCTGSLPQSDPVNPNQETSGEDFIPLNLKDLGPAPELYNQTWFNTEQPLRLADLRGKVVLLDMWTFG